MTADIRNPRTGRACFRTSHLSFAWVEAKGLTLAKIRPPHIAEYIEGLLADRKSRPTVKEAPAALKRLFDGLVVGQAVPFNPAAAVRGPRHAVKKGTTPVLTRDEMRQVLGSIDTGHVGLRDRALIGLMAFSFARVAAAVAMRGEDYFPYTKRWWVRLYEKAGRLHELLAHHKLQA